jgi:hypothetical protein
VAPRKPQDGPEDPGTPDDPGTPQPAGRQPAVDAQQAPEPLDDPGPVRVRQRAARDAAERSDPPHHYYADVPLMVGDPESGTGLVRAFSPGDPVLPADVWRHGWRDQVHPPEGYTPTVTEGVTNASKR